MSNIGLTPLPGKWLKTCITLSLSLQKMLCKRLDTLLLIMMKLSQLIINLGVVACVCCDGFKRTPLLLILKKMIGGGNVKNLT
jgi:hypothetical protein